MGVVAQEADNPEQSAGDQGSVFDLGSVSGACGASSNCARVSHVQAPKQIKPVTHALLLLQREEA